MSPSSTRPEPTEQTRRLVWAAAAGRCTFCNRLVTENEDLGVAVPIGELAHNVGWGGDSPRGDSDLGDEVRRAADNLLLLCRNCHKPADDGGVIDRFTVEQLTKLKQEHEQRIRFLTEVGGDRAASVIRVVGTIRGSQPELTYDTVLSATIAAGYFPSLLPNAYRAEYDADLRSIAAPDSRTYFDTCSQQLQALIERVNDGIRRDEVRRLAIFGFARIPVLVLLGSLLDDKIPAIVFQRQRSDGHDAWRWPNDEGDPVSFSVETARAGARDGGVCLVLNLSGTVQTEDLPSSAVRPTDTIYVLGPDAPASPGVSLISSVATLANFEAAMRSFLAGLEANHGDVEHISLFPAVPVSAAITIGRVLMPDITPNIKVFDRDEHGAFFEAVEIRA